MDRYLVVLAGAGLGGLARYVAGTWIMAKYGGRFPLGTFVINVTGSFLIGVLMTLFTERLAPAPELALVPGGGNSGRIHDVFELRVRELSGGARRRALDGAAVHGWQRGVGYVGVWLGALLAARSLAVKET